MPGLTERTRRCSSAGHGARVLGTGTHDAHVAAQDVEQLRQLVEAQARRDHWALHYHAEVAIQPGLRSWWKGEAQVTALSRTTVASVERGTPEESIAWIRARAQR